jgi:hypothetical protein
VLLISICHDIAAFLRQSPSNLIAIHCKAGKGRSGTVACAWMLHSRVFEKADDAMAYFDRMRMVDSIGINLPSQVRYVRYMEAIENEGMPREKQARLLAIDFEPVPFKKCNLSPLCFCGSSLVNVLLNLRHIYYFFCEKIMIPPSLLFIIIADLFIYFLGSVLITVDSNRESNAIEVRSATTRVSLDDPILLTHDVKLELLIDSGKTPVFTLYFNINMINGLTASFHRNELDGARENKAFKSLPENFVFTLHFRFVIQETFVDDSNDMPDVNEMELAPPSRPMLRQSSIANGTPREKRMADHQAKIPRKPTGWINKDWKNADGEVMSSDAPPQDDNGQRASSAESQAAPAPPDENEPEFVTPAPPFQVMPPPPSMLRPAAPAAPVDRQEVESVSTEEDFDHPNLHKVPNFVNAPPAEDFDTFSEVSGADL